jgi:hypothetical protein
MAERRRRERRCTRRWSPKEEHEGVVLEEAPGFIEVGVGDWGRFGLRSPRGQAQPLLQLRQRSSFTSAPSSSTHPGELGPRIVVEPRAEAQEVKPGPRRFVKLSKLLAMSSSSEEECKEMMGCEDSSAEGSRPCGPRKTKTGRPRKPRTTFELAQEAAHCSPPRIWQPVHSAQGFNKLEVQSINGLIPFSYHTRFLEEIVQQLRQLPPEH